MIFKVGILIGTSIVISTCSQQSSKLVSRLPSASVNANGENSQAQGPAVTSQSVLVHKSQTAPSSTTMEPITGINVKDGCDWNGTAKIKAIADGSTNDTVAIQNCLYAAGLMFEQSCPARAWNSTSGYPDCRPFEVLFPRGTYFVEGVWKTAYPAHSALNNSAYEKQWVVFTLPRGVAIRGEGMDRSTITLKKANDCTLVKDNLGRTISPNDCEGDRLSKRTGTYLFMAGFEKMEYDKVVNGEPTTEGYCMQPDAIIHDKICSKNWNERRASGAQNSFQDITLQGDQDALVNDWVNVALPTEEAKGMLKTQSTAIHTYRARDLRILRVKTDSWYRALHSRDGNGVSVTSSLIYNNFKGSLYFKLPLANTSPAPESTGQQPNKSYNFNIGDKTASRYPIEINSNRVLNSPVFFQRLLDKKANPFGALNGIYVTGNTSSEGCSDVSVANNTLRYSKIYFEQPCAKVLIDRNDVSLVTMAIQVGSYENVNGLNAAEDVTVSNNTIHESASGILIRGCEFNNAPDHRCITNQVKPLIRGNRIDSFLPLSGPASNKWVSLMAASKKTLAGITLVDVSNVTVDNNHIVDLRKGSQSFGIGVQTSRWNTQFVAPVGSTAASCYAPIRRSSGIVMSNNSISYSTLANLNESGIGLLKNVSDRKVGVYIESSGGVTYSDTSGSMIGVDDNRMIGSTFTTPPTRQFCTATESGSGIHCPRRIDSSNSLMSAICNPRTSLPYANTCMWTIPGLQNPAPSPHKNMAEYNQFVFDQYYKTICASNMRDPSDQEMFFPSNDY